MTIDAHADDFNAGNASRYAANADVLIDGLDNFETRYLLNDLAVRRGIPYVYGGAVATNGVSLTVLPHPAQRVDASSAAVSWTEAESTPCLRCVFPEAPPPGASATCDTAGVLGPIVTMIAAHEATQAIKLLTGNVDAVDRSLLSIDVWSNELRRFDVGRARSAGGCPCCVEGRFEYLDGVASSATTTLCGRNAVQVSPATTTRSDIGLDLAETARRLAPHGRSPRRIISSAGPSTPSAAPAAMPSS